MRKFDNRTFGAAQVTLGTIGMHSNVIVQNDIHDENCVHVERSVAVPSDWVVFDGDARIVLSNTAFRWLFRPMRSDPETPYRR